MAASMFANVRKKTFFESRSVKKFGIRIHNIEHALYVQSVKHIRGYDILYSRVSDPDPDWIRIQSGQWIRNQEGKNDPQKKKKICKSSCFEVLDGLF
jgi:hypothetical protein